MPQFEAVFVGTSYPTATYRFEAASLEDAQRIIDAMEEELPLLDWDEEGPFGVEEAELSTLEEVKPSAENTNDAE